MHDSHVDSIQLPEFFRRTDNERFFLVDNPADIVGYPSGGKRGVRTSLENDDIQLGTATLCLGRSTHPRRIAADYNQLFFGHCYFS
jgi:hypothetical protein